MNVVKSVVAGLLFVFAFAVVVPLIAIAIGSILPTPRGGGAWGWDPLSFVRSPWVWLTILVIFAAGAVWEYRRLMRQ
jgi:hypothetical protein